MNINGHEIERVGAWVEVDGEYTGWTGDSDPEYYKNVAREQIKKAKTATLVAKFVRREQAEKAEQDAARELDRRARLVISAFYQDMVEWDKANKSLRDAAYRVAFVLDADAEQKNKETKE